MAQGFSQQYGIDYEETFALTVKYDSLRLLFALAAVQDLSIHQMDVETAYLAADLQEEIYMKPLLGMRSDGKVCKLLKGLYRLKQSACIWNQKITASFVSQGFHALSTDHSVLTKGGIQIGVTIAIYVNDLLIFGRYMKDIMDIKKNLSKMFKMKDLGEVKNVLNLHVERDRERKTIDIDQTRYIRKILERFQMSDSYPIGTPIDLGTPKVLDMAYIQTKTKEKLEFDWQTYQEAIGSLMHLMVCTRPDIAYAVGRLSRYSQYPTGQHWRAV